MRRTLVALAVCLYLAAGAAAQDRIAYDCDGNYHDKDDISASPVGLALLIDAGRTMQLAHYSYSNHPGQNSPPQARAMSESILPIFQRYPFACSPIDAWSNRAGAINSLAAAINASHAGSTLTIIAAGPMDLIWHALAQSSPSARQHVTIISHSNWNNTHAHGSQKTMAHIKADFKGIDVDQIPDQNARLRTAYSKWYWLRDAARMEGRWLYGRILAAGKPEADVSDSGMVYYALYGDKYGTPEKYRAALSN